MKRITTVLMLIVLLMSLAIGCGKNNEVLNSDEIAELRSEYPLCKGINIPAISTSIGSVGIDEYFKLQNRNYDYMYAVVEFVKDKGTESYNIVMGEDTPEYKVNKQLGTPVSNAIEIYQLSVKISELICGDVTELPERIFDNSQYVTLIFNEINKEMLPEFKEGEEYVMMLGMLREDSDIREKYVNNPEIFPGEIYYITDQNNILSTQDYRNEYSGLKLDEFKEILSNIYVKASDEVA